MIQSHFRPSFPFSTARLRPVATALPGVLVLAFGLCAFAQQPAPADAAPAPAQAVPAEPQQAAPQQPAPETPIPAEAAPQTESPAPALTLPASAAVTDEELKQLLVGKNLFLRGGYLGDDVAYNEHGRLNGHSPYGSYTLCAVRINKVRLTKHKVELEGIRYGLHFLGALPSQDPTKAVDRVRITPMKKVLKLSIERESAVRAKKVKAPKAAKNTAPQGQAPEPASQSAEPSESDQLQASSAAAPATAEDDRPADLTGLTTITSAERANAVLQRALNNVFATSVDQRMLATMPRFWQLYYQAVADKSDFLPADPAVLRQNIVDRKAKLLSTFEPESNQYAQDAGVAGISLYHVVVLPDGTPGEIAVARPIGFGLDENAVSAIRKAKFEPALKDGKPVPVLLDLIVQFRIYSKRTDVAGVPEPADKSDKPPLPGPYSIEHP